MSKPKLDGAGGTAFPIAMDTHVIAELVRQDREDVIFNLSGLSKRDWFAGQAMPALVTSALDLDHIKWNAVAEHAYIIADAMLKERSKP